MSEYMKRFFYWRGMQKSIKKYVVSCDTCQRVKYLNTSMEGEYHLVVSKEPGDLLTIDFYGPLPRGRGGMQYILVTLDAFSKYVCLYQLKNATTASTLKRLLTIIYRHAENQNGF